MAGARARHIECGGIDGVKPPPELRHGLRMRENSQVQVEHRPTKANRFLKGEKGTTGEGTARDDERRIRVADVEHRADRGIGRLSLSEAGVPMRDRPIFGEATLGDPAADLETALERDVERRPIRPGLTA